MIEVGQSKNRYIEVFSFGLSIWIARGEL